MSTTESQNNPPADGNHSPDLAHHTADSPPPAEGAVPARRASAGRSRLGSMWVNLIGMSVVLVVLLIFVLQNPTRAEIKFLWLSGYLPIGVAMLFASIAGILLIAIPVTGRIWQLRRRVRRDH
jgi:uncharacterized integral membrane protein